MLYISFSLFAEWNWRKSYWTKPRFVICLRKLTWWKPLLFVRKMQIWSNQILNWSRNRIQLFVFCSNLQLNPAHFSSDEFDYTPVFNSIDKYFFKDSIDCLFASDTNVAYVRDDNPGGQMNVMLFSNPPKSVYCLTKYPPCLTYCHGFQMSWACKLVHGEISKTL
jgi:hypothetical protein